MVFSVKGCVLLLCLTVVINAATLRDLFNRPNYKFSDRTKKDDRTFWQNYDRLIEEYETNETDEPCVNDGETCTTNDDCRLMCSTGGPGFCDVSKNPPACFPDTGGTPFKDVEAGFERKFRTKI